MRVVRKKKKGAAARRRRQQETVQNSSMLRLAECHGELLLISAVRYPVGYQVFRWQSGDSKWVRTTTLGGCSLFFNILQFAGCLGPDHPAVRGNCLYIIKSNGQCIKYSLVDGSSHELVADYPARPRAWVLPSICSCNKICTKTIQKFSMCICSLATCYNCLVYVFSLLI